MFEKILFIVETSRESLHAADVVIRLAKSFDAQIIAFSVIDVMVARRMARGPEVSEATLELEESGWNYLYNVEDTAKEHGAKIVLQQIEGHPQSEVIEAARKFKVDLIVMARRRGRTTAAATSGRQAEQILDRVDCPVMII